jgi:alpha-1,3-rhamnosyl/mannosyltransferase
MKVAIDASSLVINRYSGLAEVIHNLIYNLSFDRNNGHFTLFMNFFRGQGLNVDIYYPGATNRFIRIPRRLVNLWWQHDWPQIDFYLKGIDIFHSLHINVPPVKKIKTVLTVHDCRYLSLPKLYSPKDIEIYRRQMQKALSRVDHVVTVSEFTKKELISYFSFPEERIRTIKNGISLSCPDKECNGKKILCFIKENRLPQEFILYTGVLDPRKNLSRLIEAIRVCVKEMEDFPNLVLAGIPYKQWIKSDQARQAKKLGISNKIHIAGIVDRELLYGLMKKSIALCYPSLYEGFGFPPLEAMSLGVPVLAGNSSSIPEITGKAACMVDPMSVDDIARGLCKIIYNNEYRHMLVERGFSQIKKYSWRRTATEYINLYKQVLAE